MTDEVAALRPLLTLIYQGEGGPDSYNRGRAGDSPGPYPGGLQALTIGEVLKLQSAGMVFAVGQLQVTPGTMALAIRAAGLDLGDRFTAANQDRMAAGLILRGIRRRLADYLLGRSDDLDGAQNDLALEWASLPMVNGRGAYDGLNGNRANPVKAAAVRQALQQARQSLTGRTMHSKLVGPSKRPQDFGFKPGDHHIVVNDDVETAKAYTSAGRFLWELPALARGQGHDREWNRRHTDTPPGLYKVGQVWRDYERDPNPPQSRTALSYGWFSLDLIDLEGQESRNGRAGIMIHGGGTACGWPGAWAPYQHLHPTLGCIRMRNLDLRDHVVPLLKGGASLFVSVYQER